jgi:hypothetical protein
VKKTYILEVTEEKLLQWFGHVKTMPGNRLPWKTVKWDPEESNEREDPNIDGWMDGVRRSTTNHGLTEEDTREREREKLSFG